MSLNYTAWINTLDGDHIDVTVLGHVIRELDEQAAAELPPLHWQETRLPASDYHRGDLMVEADKLLYEAGWERTDEWEITRTGYVATVERR